MVALRWAGVLSSMVALGCYSGETETKDPNGFDGGDDGGPRIILDGGGEVPSPPDGVAACPAGCNYQSGEGCSGATPSCLPAVGAGGEIAPACFAAGAAGNGAACTTSADCVAGHLCAAGSCRKLCCGGDWSGCASDAEHCIQNLKYPGPNGDPVETGAMLCFPVNTCDALAPSSCPGPGTSCQIVDPTGATACAPEGTGEAGEPCPCKGGFICKTIGGGEPSVCRRLCKAVEGGGEPSCQAGEGDCIHYATDPPGVGECTPASP